MKREMLDGADACSRKLSKGVGNMFFFEGRGWKLNVHQILF